MTVLRRMPTLRGVGFEEGTGDPACGPEGVFDLTPLMALPKERYTLAVIDRPPRPPPAGFAWRRRPQPNARIVSIYIEVVAGFD